MINKENLKLGAGAALLIASLSLGGCSLHNSNAPVVKNDNPTTTSTVAISEEQIKDVKEELDEVLNEEVKEEEVKEETKEEVNTNELDIFIPEDPGLALLDENGNILPEGVMPEVTTMDDGREALMVPSKYTLFKLDASDIEFPREEKDGSVYFILSPGVDVNEYIGVQERLYDTVKAATLLRQMMMDGKTDGVNILELEQRETQDNHMGVFVPDFYALENPFTREYTPMGVETVENGTIYYRLDGGSMDQYCAYNTKLSNFYEFGLEIIRVTREGGILFER